MYRGNNTLTVWVLNQRTRHASAFFVSVQIVMGPAICGRHRSTGECYLCELIALSFSFIFWWSRWHACYRFISFNVWHVKAKIYENHRKSNIKSGKFQRLREIYMVVATTCPGHTNVAKILWLCGALFSLISNIILPSNGARYLMLRSLLTIESWMLINWS